MQHPIVKTIKSRITAGKSVQDIWYMDLSGVECDMLPIEAKDMLEKCWNLQQLVLNNCGLTSLSNLPHLPLTIIQLISNNLSDHQLQSLSIYNSTLQQINLQHNKLSDITTISTFKSFSKLEEINLKGNPMCEIYSHYNMKIFGQIFYEHSALKIVDCYRRNGEIISDEDGKDEDLDGPAWLLEQNIEQEASNDNNNNSSAQSDNSSQCNSQSLMNKKHYLPNLYHQDKKSLPGFMINYLNQNQRFVDPIDNCFDQQISYEEKQDQEEFRTEIEKGQFKYKQSKKRKCQFRFDSREEY